MTEHTAAPVARTETAAFGLAFVLAAASGCTDGIGASLVSGVFASFMSGNTTGAGIALGTANLPTLARIGIAIPLYVLAVTVGALILRCRPRMRTAVWLVAAALLCGFVLVAHIVPPAPPTGFAPQELPLLACLVLPMGLLNMTLRHVAGSTVGLGYVTGTLVTLGESIADTLRGRGYPRKTMLFSGLWVSFFGGAALGAAAAAAAGSWAAALPAAALLSIAVADRAGRRSDR